VSKLIPIQIKTLDEEFFYGQSKHLIIGTFHASEGGNALYDYMHLAENPQPYLLLGKESLYKMLPAILEEVERDLNLWLTDKDANKRALAELIASWQRGP